jgi:hypothetical protein
MGAYTELLRLTDQKGLILRKMYEYFSIWAARYSPSDE